MRIKKILLSGFKSYRSQEKFDDFHPCSNVCVGKNGTGKSNLIFGMAHLSADFQKLRTEERKALLHQGKDSIVSGFVEIHFDNSDKRFPVDSPEVRLRRNIGLTKADYYLNGKHISSEDVMNLLESAGFSRSNPYYIVQQGKIQTLSKISPKDRLELLREVAGTRVYDDRREESLRILDETGGKREKIDEVLVFLDERLEELEKEKEELKGYQEHDRTRRVLEYTIYSKELTDINTKLDELEENHLRDIQEMADLHKKSKNMHEELKTAEKDLKNLHTDLEKLKKEKDFVQTDLLDLQQKKAQLDLKISQSTSTVQFDAKKQKEYAQELATLKKEIIKAKKELDSLQPKYSAAVKEEQDSRERMLECERRVQELISKQGRSSQFSTAKERDAWIGKEEKSMGQFILAKKQQIKGLNGDIEKINETVDQENENITNKSAIIEKHKKARDSLNEEHNQLKLKRNKAGDRRKELWRQQSEIETELVEAKEAMTKAERQLYGSLPKEQQQAIEAIKRMKQDPSYGLKGVYAPVIELFTCTEKEMTAIEVAAKSSLFHVIVDTDATAHKVLQLLTKEKAGRITLIPLNRLTVKEPTYPRTETTIPIIDRLKFKSSFRKAFLHIFGNTLLCSSIEDAGEISKTHNMDCITIEGDQINRKGALTGGYRDSKNNRLALMNTMRLAEQRRTELEENLEKIKSEILQVETLLNRVLGEMQQIDNRRATAKDEFETFQADAASSQKRSLQLQSQLIQKKESRTELEMSLRLLEENQRSLLAELGTPLVSELSKKEETELNSLNTELNQLRNSIIDLTSKRSKLQTDKNLVELSLSENLLVREEELEKHVSVIEFGGEGVDLDQTRTDLTDIESNLTTTTTSSNRVSTKIAEVTTEMEKLKNRIDELQEIEEKGRIKFQDESKNMEKLLHNRTLLQQQRDDIQKKIRDVGSLPSKNQKDYQNKTMQQLMGLLHKTKKELRAYSHVNKKALDQYVHFKEQREKLEERKVEIDQSQTAIRNLITALDEKKDAAIERTYKMVAKYFTEVFEKLTGEGSAQLVMQKSVRPDESTATTTVVPLYTGVDIKVSFTRSGKPQRVHQLSGGQQSLVALALIFAIQRCDPAPFYVFDEIDSALDDTYRLAIAEMIRAQSDNNKIQFIITTHRPEMVNHAHKHYLIEYKNKVSNVVSCAQEDALQLLEGEEDIPINREKDSVGEESDRSFDETV